MLPPDGAAVIRFKGRDTGGVATHRRAQLAIVRAFQIPRPFAQLSVYENVLAAVLYGAGLCGAGAQRLAAEGLLDRTRLELAKAIASRAKFLLLDEIASGLTEPGQRKPDRRPRLRPCVIWKYPVGTSSVKTNKVVGTTPAAAPNPEQV